ncbi:hypothetical protein KEJ13_03895 [Candidatus Bathyarchaeota archaeon]|nr:hypothetical protein [Candidatus Bathyarchaeota archaeon]
MPSMDPNSINSTIRTSSLSQEDGSNNIREREAWLRIPEQTARIIEKIENIDEEEIRSRIMEIREITNQISKIKRK